MTRLSRPIPGAFSGTKRDALASGLYSPAAAFAPSTIGFGGDTVAAVYDNTAFSRVRNILSGDDLLGYVFTWQGTVSGAPATETTHLALFLVDKSQPQMVLRRVPGSYVSQKRELGSATSHGRTELVRVPVVQLDPERIYLAAVCQESTGTWSVGVGLLGCNIQPSVVSFSVDGGMTLVGPNNTNLTTQDVVETSGLAAAAVCPGIGLATSRVKVLTAGGTEAFLF